MSGLTDDRHEPWPLIGYAPGNYQCKCGTCEKIFIGDKRAFMCLDCAATRANELLALRAAASTSTEAADAIEQCAKVVDAMDASHMPGVNDLSMGYEMALSDAAAAIRALTPPTPKVTTDEAEGRE